MYRTGSANWRSRLFFLIIGLLFTWAVHHLATGPIDPAYRSQYRTPANQAGVNTASHTADRILLLLDVETPVGKNRLVYKGRQAGCLLIDVMIPELDRGFSYRHSIPLKKAKEHFNLAGRKFALIGVSRKAARIRPLATN